MTQQEIAALARSWVKAEAMDHQSRTDSDWEAVFEVQDLKGEALWSLVQHARQLTCDARVLNMISAGPLEDLIEYEGPAFVDRIEAVAAKDAVFAELLRGVWLTPEADDPEHRFEALGCQIVDVTPKETTAASRFGQQ